MLKRQVLDLIDELTEMSENLATIINGVEFDDRNLMKPLVKVNTELVSFVGKLQDMSLQD